MMLYKVERRKSTILSESNNSQLDKRKSFTSSSMTSDLKSDIIEAARRRSQHLNTKENEMDSENLTESNLNDQNMNVHKNNIEKIDTKVLNSLHMHEPSSTENRIEPEPLKPRLTSALKQKERDPPITFNNLNRVIGRTHASRTLYKFRTFTFKTNQFLS